MVTAVFNVPLNDQLAMIDIDNEDGEEDDAEYYTGAWASYVNGWQPWNHVRTVSALAAAVSLGIALFYF